MLDGLGELRRAGVVDEVEEQVTLVTDVVRSGDGPTEMLRRLLQRRRVNSNQECPGGDARQLRRGLRRSRARRRGQP